jgi:hypothetical protein
MRFVIVLLVTLTLGWSEAARTIEFTNRCGYDLWVSPLTNDRGPALPGGIPRIGHNGRYTFQIPDGGW